jgi:hypothetical protein
MYPNTPEPLPSDYLDQIATQSSKSQSLKNPLVIAAVVAVVLILVVSVLGILASGRSKDTDTLAARLVNTKTIVDDATSKIKDSQLKAINSTFNLYLTNTIRDITPILEAEGTKITKLDAKVLSLESTSTLEQTLEDARLNAIFDRVYAREMAFRLDTTLTLMKKIYSQTSKNSLKTYLSEAYENLEPIQAQYDGFNSAKL